jgi:glucokinase
MPNQSHLILAGDIGGTKSNIALFSIVGDKLSLLREQRFASADYPSLNAILSEFLGSDIPAILGAGFGIPGVVINGRAKPTNLSWGVDAHEISLEFGIPHVSVLNDLAANAHGISCLSANDFAVIQNGDHGAKGNRCVVSPGTGLGEAGLFWDGRRHHVWACEGGHTDFAPRNELEIALLEYLIKQFGHVSAERVVSGMGVNNIYNFLRDTGRGTELLTVATDMKSHEAGAVISKHADLGTCPMCAQTLDIFVNCLAAESANMALKTMASGGVFLGGGIPVKLLSRIQSPSFIHTFNDKGRLSSLMENTPVYVILNDQAALLGAAYSALDKSAGH